MGKVMVSCFTAMATQKGKAQSLIRRKTAGVIDWSSKDLEHFYRLLIVFIIFVVAVIVGYFLLAFLVAIVRHNHEIKY